MSTQTFNDPKVEMLGEKHGPTGGMVWTVLLCLAGLQEKGGEVETTYRALAHQTFSDAATVKAVVDSAIEAGLCHEVSRDVPGVVLSLPKWNRWQAAGRKAEERARKKETGKPTSEADVTPSHEVSRDVPHSTGQGLNNNSKDSPPLSPTPQPNDLAIRVCSILQGGIDGLSDNDHGRMWPAPKRPTIDRLVAECDPALAEQVARDVREIVQSQDRAPNVTALFEQKLRKAQVAEGLGVA
jgi:hypothetical protein